MLLRYSRLIAREILEGEDLKDHIKTLLNLLLDYNKPKNFKPDDKENVLLMMDKSYQKTIFSFSENNIYNSENFSMFEFRTAIELLKERNEKFKADMDKMKQQ